MLKIITPDKSYWNSVIDFVNEIKTNPTEYDIHIVKTLMDYIDDCDFYFEFIDKVKNGFTKYIPSQIFWILDDNQVIGIFDLRLQLNEKLMNKGGNLAYMVKPSYRGKRIVLSAYPLLCDYINSHYDFDRLLLTCDEKNILSHRVILSLFKNFGGEQLFSVKISDKETQIRYWINVK